MTTTTLRKAPESDLARSIRRAQKRRMWKHLMALHAIKDEGYSLDIMLELAFGDDMESRRDLRAAPGEKQAIKELYQEVLLNGR